VEKNKFCEKKKTGFRGILERFDEFGVVVFGDIVVIALRPLCKGGMAWENKVRDCFSAMISCRMAYNWTGD
jgi:hypothetical protein